MPKFLYVIGLNNSFSKIGVAADVHRRRADLQVGCPIEIEIFTTFLIKNNELSFEIEAEIHRRLARFQTSGEWFKIPPRGAVSVVEATLIDLWSPKQSGALDIERIKNIHSRARKGAAKNKMNNSVENLDIDGLADLVARTVKSKHGKTLICPHCSHQSLTAMSNKEIWNTRFRCSGCGASVDGRKFFIRRVA
jgi:Meiotically up-regulated gene 113